MTGDTHTGRHQQQTCHPQLLWSGPSVPAGPLAQGAGQSAVTQGWMGAGPAAKLRSWEGLGPCGPLRSCPTKTQRGSLLHVT